MADSIKTIKDVCSNIWKMRKSPGIWVDREQEITTEENLICKSLEGLYAVLLPVAEGLFPLASFPFQQDLEKEAKVVVGYLLKEDVTFYPAPHTYAIQIQPDDYIDMAAVSLRFALIVEKKFPKRLSWRLKPLPA